MPITSDTRPPDTTAPRFDPELSAALHAMGVENIAVGLTASDIVGVRVEMAQLSPSLDDLAADTRFTVVERTVPGPPGNDRITVLIATPHQYRPARPLLFHTHGGGLVSGDHRLGVPDLLDHAAHLDAVVVSVDYRLAPEHPYPAAHDDSYAALLWCARHADELGVDPAKIVLWGGSAGGNLAAGLALHARDSAEVELLGQVLLYPMLDDRNDSWSARQMHGRGVWDDVTNRMAWAGVLGDRDDDPPAYAAPARARVVTDLPPTYLEVGSAETFRDETLAFAQRIWSSGGDAELHVWPGAFHGFDLFAPDTNATRRARTTRQDWLDRLLRNVA